MVFWKFDFYVSSKQTNIERKTEYVSITQQQPNFGLFQDN